MTWLEILVGGFVFIAWTEATNSVKYWLESRNSLAETRLAIKARDLAGACELVRTALSNQNHLDNQHITHLEIKCLSSVSGPRNEDVCQRNFKDEAVAIPQMMLTLHQSCHWRIGFLTNEFSIQLPKISQKIRFPGAKD